jgi:ankyrin repeat protein
MRNLAILTFIVIGAWHHFAANAETPGASSAGDLRRAIDTNDVQAVAQALDAGADPNAYDEYALTPLVRAVIGGNESIVTELLKRGANPNPRRAARSPLEVAFSFVTNRRAVCNVSLVKLLLEKGANPNDVFPSLGEQPLPRALELGDINCVDTLIDFGADPRVFSEKGKPALQAAVQGASETKQIDLVNRMLARGLDVDGPPGRRGGPLIEATWHNNVPLVRLLLSHGADPCLAEPGKVSAWDFANARRLKEIHELMASYKCKSP